MKNITKIRSTYTYPPRGKSEPAIIVGFFLEERTDRYGNPLRKINIVNRFGEIKSVDYVGKTLMISVCTGSKTTCVRRATREDLTRYKEALNSYAESLDLEERKFHDRNLSALIGEESDQDVNDKHKAEKKSLEAAAEKELLDAKAEIEKLKAELEKGKKKVENKNQNKEE